jgi:hypothetical protein
MQRYNAGLRGAQVRAALIGKVRVVRLTERKFAQVPVPSDVGGEAREFAVDLRLYRDFLVESVREVPAGSTLKAAFVAHYNRRAVHFERELNRATRRLVRALEQGLPVPAPPPPKGFS